MSGTPSASLSVNTGHHIRRNSCESEIPNSDLHTLYQKNVLWLNITVRDLLRMEKRQTVEHLKSYLYSPG